MFSAYDIVRQRLSLVLGFDGSGSKASLVMFPSGSDAEFLPLVVALIRSNAEGGEQSAKFLFSIATLSALY